MTGAPVVEARAVRKVFGGTTALAGVDFRLERGRVHALIGENGAGKSTLLKVLAGIEAPSDGVLLIDGRAVRLRSARDAAARGIGMIHQELQLFPELTVAENLFVGRERRTRWGPIAWDTQVDAARRTLERLGHPSISPLTRVGALALGQQQIVEIARALVHDVRILLMDEPTSALTGAEVPVLFQVIRDLTRHGVSVVYISHRLEELLAIADDITVLRDGRVAGSSPASGIDVAWIVERMTGGTAAARSGASPAAVGAVVLDVRRATLPAAPGRSALDAVSVSVQRGEIVGLYGLMGAGRTELFESIMGIHADAAGPVLLDGAALEGNDVAERVQAGLAMVPEDRQAAGLVQTLSVAANMTLSSLGRLTRYGWLSPRAEDRAVRPFVERLRVRTPSPATPVTALSGGNQQKVVLARSVMSRPTVLLVDEPTRGVDVGAKAEIHDALRQLASEGIGIVFATADLADIQAVATRVVVMARGRVTAEFAAAEATADALASAASRMTDIEGGARARP